MEHLIAYRNNLKTLSSVFSEATGYAVTTTGRIVAGDPKFFVSLSSDRIVRAGTYTRIVERFSALWPPGLEWPGGIDRPEPADVEEKVIARVASMTSQQEKIHPDWPEGVQWPQDIPKPVSTEAHAATE